MNAESTTPENEIIGDEKKCCGCNRRRNYFLLFMSFVTFAATICIANGWLLPGD